MTYRVISHLGTHYKGEDLKLANMYADSVIEVEECFGYKTWPVYESIFQPKYIIRQQVCYEDIYRFISVEEIYI